MAKRRGRRRFTEAELDAADVILEDIISALRRCTLAMEAPLGQAMHLIGTIELALHAPDDHFRAIGFVAIEARTRLENVKSLWRELRAETCIDTEPSPHA